MSERSPTVVHWRLGRAGEGGLPALADAGAWLSPEECARAGRLALAKRRSDWLLGRLTLKALLSRLCAERFGTIVAPRHIVIEQQPSGAPAARLSEGAPGRLGTLAAGWLPFAVSSSHSRGRALGAATWTGGGEEAGRWSVGADIECVDPRSEEFVRDFFTAAEGRYWAAGESAGARDRRATQVWSAKESVLKMLQLGLRVDTCSLTCIPSPSPGEGEPASPAAGLDPDPGDWASVAITCDPPIAGAATHVRGWWRADGEYVTTIVLGRRTT